MKKKLALAGLAAAALTAPAAASTTHHNCGHLGATAGHIKATNVSCTVARKLVRAEIQGKKYGHFTCKSKPYQGGANVSCHTGKKKVTFQVAD